MASPVPESTTLALSSNPSELQLKKIDKTGIIAQILSLILLTLLPDNWEEVNI
ncbi:16560_t:CDS:2 [Acaulospora colombiana]|uniref:16560_t:CDS:1 n=1 Tax=Acaulospora colombiana TaxID=27376 RepID=A0ACA9PU00_9GLOM|nr:16560_t:CDS:2 [Acaulospora colombiana]